MKKHLYLFILIVLSVIPLVSLAHFGLPQTHDGVDHVARIANFYQSLSEGNLLPRWAASLNWGYGHPILMFLYPLPSYLASLFHFFGANYVDSTKLVFAATFVASTISMYLFLSSFVSRRAAFLGALIYAFSPYRFVDLYVRGAIGEHVAFVFPPLVCLAVRYLAVKKTNLGLFLGWMSVSGLLLSHNAISVMFLPIFSLYALYLYLFVNRSLRFLLTTLLLFLGGFILSAFFWIPAFFEGKYTLRDIVTGNEYLKRFESFGRFVYSPWNYGGTGQFSVEIGLVPWVSILLLPLATYQLSKKKNPLFIIGAGVLILFFIALFLMTSESIPLWRAVTILQKFQFPWRLLSVAVFLASIAAALVVESINGKKAVFFVFLTSAIVLLQASNFWHAKAFVKHPESFYSGVYNGTTDTGESAPIWSVRFMEHSPTAASEVVEGDAVITPGKRTTTRHEYSIVATVPSKILENTLYFPGWKILINNQEVPVEFQNPAYRGLMTYAVPEGKSEISVVFQETKLRLVSDYFSAGAIVLTALYAVYLFSQRLWRRFR